MVWFDHAPSLSAAPLYNEQAMSALPKPDDLTIGLIHDPLSWAHWPVAKAFLDPALMMGDEDWPEVEAALTANEQQLWAVMDGNTVIAAAVTRIALTRGGEVVEVYLVGGDDYRRWIAALNDTIEVASREIGCVAMRAYGRLGWLKTLTGLGWRPKVLAYEKVFV